MNPVSRLISPELRRNLWLEFTVTRLVLMPAVLIGIVELIRTLTGPFATGLLIPASAVLFILVTVLWGVNLAMSNLAEEAVQRTWDWQRMSSITPLELTVGKLAGAPSYAWYGGLICLLVFIAAGLSAGFGGTAYWVGLLIGTAILFHAVAMLAMALSINKYGAPRAGRFRALLLLGIVFLLIGIGQVSDPGSMLDETRLVRWYGRTYPSGAFLLISIYLLAGWGCIGLYRTFRAELGLRNAPWTYTAFVIFLMAFLAGFVDESGNLAASLVSSSAGESAWRLATAALVGAVLTLGALLQEPHNPVPYRRLLQGGWPFPWHLIPGWGIALALTTAVVACIAMLGGAGSDSVLVAMWLFLIRDTAVILTLNLRPSGRSANGLILVYLVVAYGLLPALPGESGWFLPAAGDPAIPRLIPPAIEAALAICLLVVRWKRRIRP